MPSTPTASANAPPYAGAGAGAHHQIVKPPAQTIFTPPHFNPVPVAVALKGGTPGTAYTETISAQGGTSPYTFAITGGSLPTGTSLTGSTGVIAGTPTTVSAYSFTITVTDANGFTRSQGFVIIIAASTLSNYAFFS